MQLITTSVRTDLVFCRPIALWLEAILEKLQVQASGGSRILLGSSLLHLRGIQQPKLPHKSAENDILLFNGVHHSREGRPL